MTVAVLKIALADVEPPVTRTVEVPLDIRLDRLHRVIQAAMGWQDRHLYAFTAGRTARWATPDPEFDLDDTVAPSQATLADLLAAAGRTPALYTYDMGDCWEHRLSLAGTREAAAGEMFPRLVGASGRCPPEDCGGAPGFERMLEVLADPADPEHADMLDWLGGPFDPADAEADLRRAAVDRLARTWARARARKPGGTGRAPGQSG